MPPVIVALLVIACAVFIFLFLKWAVQKPSAEALPDSDAPTLPQPFDPRIHISADAKYIVKRLVIWFLVIPAILGIIALVITSSHAATITQQSASQPAQVLLSLYSQRGKTLRLKPEVQPWRSPLWIDHRKVAYIPPGHFITLKLPDGDHSIAGMDGWLHESKNETVISLHAGKRYFVRLIGDSHIVAGFGSVHYVAEETTCQEARGEAATTDPIKLKRIDKAVLESVVPEPYFPECEK